MAGLAWVITEAGSRVITKAQVKMAYRIRTGGSRENFRIENLSDSVYWVCGPEDFLRKFRLLVLGA